MTTLFLCSIRSRHTSLSLVTGVQTGALPICQAIGGVINIVTAAPEKALEGSFDLEAGSRETVSARAAIGGRTGTLAWRIGGQRFATDGNSSHAKAFGGVERAGYTKSKISGGDEQASSGQASSSETSTSHKGAEALDNWEMEHVGERSVH